MSQGHEWPETLATRANMPRQGIIRPSEGTIRAGKGTTRAVQDF